MANARGGMTHPRTHCVIAWHDLIAQPILVGGHVSPDVQARLQTPQPGRDDPKINAPIFCFETDAAESIGWSCDPAPDDFAAGPAVISVGFVVPPAGQPRSG